MNSLMQQNANDRLYSVSQKNTHADFCPYVCGPFFDSLCIVNLPLSTPEREFLKSVNEFIDKTSSAQFFGPPCRCMTQLHSLFVTQLHIHHNS